MTIGQAVATLAGGFLFPFMIRIIQGKMMEDFGAIGGWVAATFIVGTVSALNHGIRTPLIFQSAGEVWIDMVIAAAVGLYVASVIRGGKILPSLTNIAAGITGGILAGLLLSFIL